MCEPVPRPAKPRKMCFLLWAAFASLGWGAMADPVLPRHSVSLVCDPDTETYVQELRSVFDFARDVAGLPVYLSIDVQASDGSGACALFETEQSRDDPQRPDDHGIRHHDDGRETGDLIAWARTLGFNAGTTSLTLPDTSALPPDGLHELRTSSRSFFRYVGPAVLRTFVSNGNDHVIAVPITDSHRYWREIMQLRQSAGTRE